MKLLVILSLLFVVSLGIELQSQIYKPSHTVSPRNPNPHVIEFSLSQKELSFLLPLPVSPKHHVHRLFTFDITATVQTLQNSEMLNMLKAAGKYHTCVLKQNNEVLSAHTALQILRLANDVNSYEIVCTRTISQISATHYKLLPFTAAHTFPSKEEIYNSVPYYTQGPGLPKHVAPEIVANWNPTTIIDDLKPYPFLGIEIIADTPSSLLGWGAQWLEHHFGTLHAFQTYSGNQTGIWHINTAMHLTPEQVEAGLAKQLPSDEPIVIAMAADWGAGTQEADYVAARMAAHNPHYTIHAGDVYYIGTQDEYKSNVLGIAPAGVKQGVKFPSGSLGTFALEGNHEMYSRGYGYFDDFLPTIGTYDPQTGRPSGQAASYFSLENSYWRVIGIDTGYHTYSVIKPTNSNNTMPDELVDWLQNVARINDPTDTRGIVILSHHQSYSAFEHPSLATPEQIAALIPTNKTIVWLWGHEHRMSVYNLTTQNLSTGTLSTYGRCVGNSGFPPSISPIPSRARESGLYAYDDRVYTTLHGLTSRPIGFNGYNTLTLNGPQLTIDYFSLALGADGNVTNTNSTWLFTETFNVTENGSVNLMYQEVVDPDLTIVSNA